MGYASMDVTIVSTRGKRLSRIWTTSAEAKENRLGLTKHHLGIGYHAKAKEHG